MTTQILGLIIVIGVIIFLLARRQLRKYEDDPEVLEASTGRLRYELEQSADEIINRMTEKIEYLEALLQEADSKTRALEEKLKEVEEGLQVEAFVPNNLEEKDLSYEEERAEAVEVAISELPINEKPLTEAQLKALEYIREASMELEAQQQEIILETEEEKPLLTEEGKEKEIQLHKKIEGSTAMARALIKENYSMEEISQLTGLGIGALELLKQMERNAP